MLSLLMLAAGAIGTPHAGPPTACAHVELFARVSSTRFIAVNPTDTAQLLIFSDARGVLATRVLPPQGAMEERFPSGASLDLSIQVVTAPDLRLRPSWRLVSPQVALSDLEGSGAVRWTIRCCDPASAIEPLHFQPPPAQPHVPVPLPDDEPRGNIPPRLERLPPPPI